MMHLPDTIAILLAGIAPDGTPVATYREDAQKLGEETDSFYDPCATGLHLCGQTDDENQPTTMGNWHTTAASAQETFDFIKSHIGEVAEEEADYILDLQIGGETVTDLRCNRQLLLRLAQQENENA